MSNTDRRAEPLAQDVPAPKYSCCSGDTLRGIGTIPKPEYMQGPSRFGMCIGPSRCSFDFARGAAKAWRPYGSLAPLWCCQATQRVFSGFSCFVEQRSCKNFGLEIEPVYDRWDVSSCGSCPQARVGQGSLLSGMSVFRQRKMLDTHHPRGTSAPNLPTGFKSPGASTGARRSKSLN